MVVAPSPRPGRQARLGRAGNRKPAAQEPDRVAAVLQRDPRGREPEACRGVCGEVYGADGAGTGGNVCEVWHGGKSWGGAGQG